MHGVAIAALIAAAAIDKTALVVALSGAAFMALWFNDLVGDRSKGSLADNYIVGSIEMLLVNLTATLSTPSGMGEGSIAKKCTAVFAAYAANLTLFMSLENIAETGTP